MTADSRFDVWALRDTETGFAPGERFYYSNVGYRTLGYALEAATGTPYPRAPAQAASSSRWVSSTRSRRSRSTSATGWRSATTGCTTTARLRRDDPLFPAPWLETGTADGSLASTAGDLAAFGSASAGGTREDTHLGAARSSPATAGATATGSSARATSSGTAARCPASPRRCSATSTRAMRSASLMNGPDEHDATEVVAQFALDLHRGAKPAPPGDAEPCAARQPTCEPTRRVRRLLRPLPELQPLAPGLPRRAARERAHGVQLAWGDDKPLTPLGEAEFRVGEEEWSPERLRFDAVVDGQALRANLSGESVLPK